MINYVLLTLGIFTILAAIMFIYIDKLKGEDIYFDIDVKEQEIKKAVEDADEIISELNYTSEMIVKEIEEKLNDMREELNNMNNKGLCAPSAKKYDNQSVAVPAVVAANKNKKLTNDNKEKDEILGAKLSSKQQTVFDYAKKGMSVTDIAKKMNIGQGEVMLILSMNNEVE